MNRAFVTAVFITLFISIVFLMHFYAFSRLWGWLGLTKKAWFFPLIILLTVSFIIASIIERTIDGLFGKVIYIAAVSWLGSVFLLFFITLLFDGLNLALKLKGTLLAGIVVGVWLIIITYSFINAATLDTREVNITLAGLEKPVRAVHLSDIHLGAVRNVEYSREIAKKVNDAKPDVVFITGDLADGSGAFTIETIQPFNSILAPIYYVSGNHENYLGLENVMNIVNGTKIKPLRGAVENVSGLQVVGFDYPFEGEVDTLKKGFASVKLSGKPSILLYHAPQELDQARKANISLMLTGHVHGGQIIPFNFFVRLVFPYTGGLHDYDGMAVFVSRGVGTWGPPMRLGTRNELVVLNLHPEKK